MKKLTLAAVIATLFTSAAIAGDTAKIMVPMQGSNGAELGHVMLKSGHNGLIVEARMENVPEGWHGFHIHEVGSCKDVFKAAKGHYNPEQASHGINHGDKRHGGDLPNIYAAADGKVRADIFTSLVTLADGPTTLLDADGSSFIVHEKADTYEENAGAGGRIACGVISAAK